MKHRFCLLIPIVNIAFLFFFSTDSSAASTLVEGNSDSLSVLTYTKYLDDDPVLFFSEQIEDKKVNFLNKIDNIVLYDSTWRDLAVEFAVQSEIVSPRSTVKIEKDGIYEVFVNTAQSTIRSPRLEIEIDGEEMLGATIYEPQDVDRKYLKLGEREQKAGRHLIEIKNIGQNSKIFLVNKQKRLRAEEIIWQKMNKQEVDTAYIFSQDGEFYVPKGKSYTLKMRVVPKPTESQENVIYEISANLPLLEIDGEEFFIGDYIGRERVSDADGFWYELNNLDLQEGKHKIGLLTSDNFKVDLVVLEPVTNNQKPVSSQEPEITFTRINPTKYLVKVSQARGPFWLVFSESFHKGWRLYESQVTGYRLKDGFKDIVADYSKLRVKEARHLQRFTPGDIKYLFRQSDVKEHFLVNGYANGWYIDPRELGLDQDFTLVLYFWPQSLFYFGLIISGSTLLFCVGYLLYDWRRKYNAPIEN